MAAPAAAPPATAVRVIPGFKAPLAPAPTKPRSRPKKAKAPTDAVTEKVEEPAVKEVEVAAEVDEVDEVVEDKKTSSVEAVQKRIRAASKKIQRIVIYEEKTEALNKDQQQAVATKPAVEATVKELQELLVILKAEEQEDIARLSRVQYIEEKKQARAIQAAVTATKTEAQSDLVLLLQFFHLHGLYTAQNTGFAPPVLPAVVANATGQEVAAVRCLYDAFANGPLLGGHGDALEKLFKVASGSEDKVLPAVSFARIKELIEGLTSAPAAPSVEAAAPAPVPDTTTSSALPTAADSVISLLDGSAEPSPSFLQASELTSENPEAEGKVTSWADEVEIAESRAATPPPIEAPAPIEESWSASAPVTNGTADSWSAPAAAAVDWSAEEQSTELPSLEGLVSAPAAPAPVVVESDGFQTARGSRRGGERGGPRGGRGGERRGGYRGGRGRGGFEGGEGRERPEGGWGRAPREGGEGGFRRGGGDGEGRGGSGGEFRGRGRGRGNGEGRARGGNRNPANAEAGAAAHAPTPAPAAAPAADKW